MAIIIAPITQGSKTVSSKAELPYTLTKITLQIILKLKLNARTNNVPMLNVQITAFALRWVQRLKSTMLPINALR